MSWSDLVDVVSPVVLRNAAETSRRLTELGVPHAVIGGVAVGVLGYARATRDVDFLIGREGEDESHPHGFSSDVAELFQKDVVEFLLVHRREPDQAVLLDGLKRPVPTGEIPVVSPRELVWLKLSTPSFRRQHDHNDIRHLLHAGAIDAGEILEWLLLLDPGKGEDFSDLIQGF